MKKIIILLFCSSIVLGAFAQSANTTAPQQPSTPTVNPTPFAERITAEDLRKHLTIIASDEFEGRETGQKGNEMAANYIAEEFKKMGLPAFIDNSYFQPVGFEWNNWEKITMKVKGKKYRHIWDFFATPGENKTMALLETEEVIFLGYGIDDPKYSDYKNKNVKGKVILIYQGEPRNKKDVSYLTGTKEASDWTGNWKKKVEAAQAHGVAQVLFIEDEIQKVVAANASAIISPSMKLDETKEGDIMTNHCFISRRLAKSIMGKKYRKVVKARKKITKKGKRQSVKLKTKLELSQKLRSRRLTGVNVLGFIEGTDPLLKDEVVVVTAHYDHLGKRGDGIYNGADDNGSGTSTVLEVAEAFATAKEQGAGPRRSVLCMLVTGEEKGLLGSQYYSEHPIFPLEKTVADVNVDMVGRVDDKYKNNPNYIYVIGSDRLSTELHSINESVNKKYTNLTLDYTYNEDDDPNRYYYRSDHYNFAEKGIPSIFYFNGTHADYHKTSDTIDKINFEKMAIIGQLVFHTSWELANRDKRIEVDVTGRN